MKRVHLDWPRYLLYPLGTSLVGAYQCVQVSSASFGTPEFFHKWAANCTRENESRSVMALSVVNEDFYNDLSLEAVLTGLNCNNHFSSRVSRRLSPSLSIFAKAASGSGLPPCEKLAQSHLAGGWVWASGNQHIYNSNWNSNY